MPDLDWKQACFSLPCMCFELLLEGDGRHEELQWDMREHLQLPQTPTSSHKQHLPAFYLLHSVAHFTHLACPAYWNASLSRHYTQQNCTSGWKCSFILLNESRCGDICVSGQWSINIFSFDHERRELMCFLIVFVKTKMPSCLAQVLCDINTTSNTKCQRIQW